MTITPTPPLTLFSPSLRASPSPSHCSSAAGIVALLTTGACWQCRAFEHTTGSKCAGLTRTANYIAPQGGGRVQPDGQTVITIGSGRWGFGVQNLLFDSFCSEAFCSLSENKTIQKKYNILRHYIVCRKRLKQQTSCGKYCDMARFWVTAGFPRGKLLISHWSSR